MIQIQIMSFVSFIERIQNMYNKIDLYCKKKKKMELKIFRNNELQKHK